MIRTDFSAGGCAALAPPRLDATPEPPLRGHAAAPRTPGTALRFEGFELHPGERRLVVAGRQVEVGSRAFDLLLALTEQAGALATKDQLFDRVWPGMVVAENNIHVHVSALRKVLGNAAITTIPGRGYRFTARPLSGPAPAVVSSEGVVARVPRTPAPLFGREEEVATLLRLLSGHRLVTVAGPGGVGKTALVAAALHALPPAQGVRVRWVDLHAQDSAEHLPTTLEQAIEPVGAAAGAPLLLVLDGAEHLLDAVAQWASQWQDALPGLRLLVTSQAVLQLEEEHVLRLEPLPTPDGLVDMATAAGYACVQLFEREAQAADQRFSLMDTNIASVVRICRQLQGHPLAIRLAAQRAHVLGLEALQTHLPQHLDLLRNASRGAPGRQLSLTAAFDWSFQLLRDNERRVLCRLSVFKGRFTLSQAMRVAADPALAGEGALDEWAVIDILARLVDRSLISLDRDLAGGYHLAPTIRHFAAQHLDLAGETAAARRLADEVDDEGDAEPHHVARDQNDSAANSQRSRTEAGDPIDSSNAPAIPPAHNLIEKDHHACHSHFPCITGFPVAGESGVEPAQLRPSVCR